MLRPLPGALRVLVLASILADALRGPPPAGEAARRYRPRQQGRQRLPYFPASPPLLAGALGAKGPAPREITLRLARAGSAREILSVFELDGDACNDINLAAVWNQLGKARLGRRERADFFREHEATLLRLEARTDEIVSQLSPRNIAGVSYGIARLGFAPAQQTMRLLAAEATPRLHEFNSQELANVALAFATAGVSDPQLFEAIGREARARIGEYNAQELANTAWAFAKLSVPADELFNAIAREAEPRLGEFIAQGLANTAWAFATAAVPAEGLLDAIASQSAPRLAEFKTQELANIAWAFATAGVPSARLFDAIAHEAFPRVYGFTTQGLANLVWAFAKAGIPADALFLAVAREATGGATVAGEQRRPRLSRFTTQELANTAFAFARAGTSVRDDRLYAGIAEQTLARIGDFNEQEIANTAWAFASVGIAKPALFDAMGGALLPMVSQLSSHGLTNTLLAFSKAGWPMRRDRGAELRRLLAEQVETRAHAMCAPELANAAWSLAVSSELPLSLVRALNARAGELGPGAFSIEERSAVHQYFLGVQLETRPPADALAPAELRDACREAIIVQSPARSSQLHLDVSAMLSRIGVAHVNELCVPRLGYHVDIAIVPHASRRAPNAAADAGVARRAAARAGAVGGSSAAQLLEVAAARARRAVVSAVAACEGILIEVNGPSHYDRTSF
ncbi:hypothetical protein T492DRAFT_856404 [Pavlovales sp. CCMP2436]|nr:hypothetical protein T492DRAFT_856404 [Pavlovales sp. CCMP2436]